MSKTEVRAERRFTERRAARVKIEKRAEGQKVLIGYAAVYYRAGDPATEYRIWDDFVERIMPGAFQRAIAENDDARALFNHSPSLILGRISARTLRLNTDEVGLRYEVDLPDTQAARDLAVSVEREDITGSSFGFIAQRVTWVEEEKLTIRQVEAVELFDVGPVTYPAYEGTTTGLRSSDLEAIRHELEAFRSGREVVSADEIDLRADLVKRGLTDGSRAA